MAPITPTALPDNTRVKTNASGMITGGLKKTTYVALIAERDQLTAELQSVNKQVCESNQTNLGLTQQIQTLTKSNQDGLNVIEERNSRISEITENLKERDEEIKRLTGVAKQQADDIGRLQASLEDAVKSLKDGGKYAKSEQSKDIKSKVWGNIKDRHYRTLKFVRDEELTELTKTVYADLKGSIKDDSGNPMAESEFVRIYESYVQESLGARRQYTQTQLQEAFVSEYSICVCD